MLTVVEFEAHSGVSQIVCSCFSTFLQFNTQTVMKGSTVEPLAVLPKANRVDPQVSHIYVHVLNCKM